MSLVLPAGSLSQASTQVEESTRMPPVGRMPMLAHLLADRRRPC